jgi:uncharacterized protein
MSEPPRKRSWPRRLRRWFIFSGLLYLGIVVLMWSFENYQVYPRETAADHWEEPPDPAIEDVTFHSANGVTIHGWYLRQAGALKVVLICHGNAGNLSYRGQSLLRFREHLGCSALIFDYPGYGKSTGKPSEEGCYASAEAAIDWLQSAQGISSERIILFGDSLGGGVAVESARRRSCNALVLSKTFTSLPAVAKRIYPFLPVYWLMRNRFDNLSKMPDLRLPVFIASATLDDLVPFEMGKQLFAAAPEPKEFLALQGEGHNDRLSDEFMFALRRFLDRHAP